MARIAETDREVFRSPPTGVGRAFGVLGVSAVLVLVGLLIQRSVSENTIGQAWHEKQAMWLLRSLVLGAFVYLIPFRWILTRAWLGYGAIVVLLLGVAVLGRNVNGSERWLVLGPLRLQPSEPMKLVFIIALARWLRYRTDMRRASSLLAPILLTALPAFLIFLQPDLSTAVLFPCVGMAMVFCAGARTGHVARLCVAGAVMAVLVYGFALEPYQQERVLSTVMRHRQTPYEKSLSGYQLDQSLKSIAVGGVTGAGVGEGPLNRMNRLPHRHNDFIFSVVAEETGLIGVIVLLLALVTLILIILGVGVSSREPGARLFCIGVATLVGVQTSVHIGVCLGLIPTTGMTLPFVSYGGSSLITFAAAVAGVANIARNRTPVLAGNIDREQIDRLCGL